MTAFTHMIVADATPREINRVLETTPDISSTNPSNPAISFEIDGIPYEANAAQNKGKTGFLLKEGGMLPAEDLAEILVDYLADHGIRASADEFTAEAIMKLAPTPAPAPAPAPTKSPMQVRIEAIQQKMPRDKFVQAMLDRVVGGQRLTPNMIKAIEKIENQLANPTIDQAIVDRIDAILSRIPSNQTRTRDFLNSLKDQALNGRKLSPKQVGAIEKFEAPKSTGGAKTISLSAFNRMDKGDQRMLVLGPEAQRAIGLSAREMTFASRLISAPTYDHSHGIPAKDVLALRDKFSKTISKHPVLTNFSPRVAKEIIYDMIR